MKISIVQTKISTCHCENKSRLLTEMALHNFFRYLFSLKVFHNYVLLIKEAKAWKVRTIGCTENFGLAFPKLND